MGVFVKNFKAVDPDLWTDLIEQIPQQVWATDDTGELLFSNHRLVEMLDIPTATGDAVVRFDCAVHPEDLPSCLVAWNRSLQNQEMFEHKHRLRHRESGEYRWYLARGNPIRNSTGAIHLWVGTNTDIHDLKRAKDARRLAEEKYQKLIELTETGYVIADACGKVVDANDEYVKLTGHQRFAEIKGCQITEWTAPGDLQRHAEYFNQCLTKGTVSHLEVEYVSGDQKTTAIDVNATAFNSEGELVFMALCRDISERRKTQKAVLRQRTELAHLARVNTMGQLATGLAHELNQPLGAILNYSGICRNLIQNDLTAETQKTIAQAFNEISKESQRAGEIIRRLRMLVRKDEPHGQSIDLNRELTEVVNLLSFDLRDEIVQVKFRLHDKLPPVFADRVEVQQVVVNLLRNAIDALSVEAGRREILIESVIEGTHVLINVTDNGAGISVEKLETVFEPFYTTKPLGLGMGLSICRSIIESNGGRLKVESKPGKTTFSFTLPLANGDVKHVKDANRDAA